MPNIKSAKKRVKVIEKKTLRNNMIKSGYKSAVKKFEQAVEAGNIDEALKMLFILRDGKAIPLPAEKEQQLRKKFKYFPVVDYKLDYYSFSSTDNNDVKFQIEFFKHTSSDDHTPNTIGFMFNPVKIDGVWYLAVKEATKEATDK